MMNQLSYRKGVDVYVASLRTQGHQDRGICFAMDYTVRMPWRAGGRIVYGPRRLTPPSTGHKIGKSSSADP